MTDLTSEEIEDLYDRATGAKTDATASMACRGKTITLRGEINGEWREVDFEPVE